MGAARSGVGCGGGGTCQPSGDAGDDGFGSFTSAAHACRGCREPQHCSQQQHTFKQRDSGLGPPLLAHQAADDSTAAPGQVQALVGAHATKGSVPQRQEAHVGFPDSRANRYYPPVVVIANGG